MVALANHSTVHNPESNSSDLIISKLTFEGISTLCGRAAKSPRLPVRTSLCGEFVSPLLKYLHTLYLLHDWSHYQSG